MHETTTGDMSFDPIDVQPAEEPPADLIEGIRTYAAVGVGLAMGAIAYAATANLMPDKTPKKRLTKKEAEQLRRELDERQAPNPSTGKDKWDPKDANDVLQEIENETDESDS